MVDGTIVKDEVHVDINVGYSDLPWWWFSPSDR